MRVAHLAVSLMLFAACGKKDPAPVADTIAATQPGPDALVETDTVMSKEDSTPAPTFEADPNTYLVWWRTEKGDVTSWVSADGEGVRIEATRPQLVVFADETLFGMESRYTAFTETNCEDFENGKKTQSGKRWLPHLVARGLAGQDAGKTHELTSPKSSYFFAEPTADGVYELVGEHWGRTPMVVGSWRGLVLVNDCEGAYGCGAHGDMSCGAKAVALGTDAPRVDLEQVAKHVAEPAKETLAGWEGDEGEIEKELDHLRFKSKAGELEVDYFFVTSVPYAGSDGTWSSYSQSRTYSGKPVAPLGLEALPELVKKAMQKAGVDGYFGWSIIKPTHLEEARRAFDDPTTLPAPAPADEVATPTSEDPKRLLEEGRKLTRDKSYPSAIEAFDKAIALDPKLARAWSGRGYAKLLAGDLDAAKADLDHALTLDQSKKLVAAVHFNLGEIAEKQGDKGLAKEHYQKAYDQIPTDAAKKRLEALSAP